MLSDCSVHISQREQTNDKKDEGKQENTSDVPTLKGAGHFPLYAAHSGIHKEEQSPVMLTQKEIGHQPNI